MTEARARKDLADIEDWKAAEATPAEVKLHDRMVLDRLTLEEAFGNSAVRNQRLADRRVLTRGEEGEDVSLSELKLHADLTKTNKSTVLGNEPVVKIENHGEGKTLVAMPAGMAHLFEEPVDVDEEQS